MKLSEVCAHFAELIETCGDIDFADLREDYIPDEVAERVLRDVDLTLLPQGLIYATAWDLDDESDIPGGKARGSFTPVKDLFAFMADNMNNKDLHPTDQAEARECLELVFQHLGTILQKA